MPATLVLDDPDETKPAPGQLRRVQALINTLDRETNDDRLADPEGARPLLVELGLLGSDAQGGLGVGRFNVPPLTEAADTAPFFHNNAIKTLEEAIAFYSSDEFFLSPGRSFCSCKSCHAQACMKVSVLLALAGLSAFRAVLAR